MTIFRRFHHLYFLIPITAYGVLYLILSQTSRSISHDVALFLEIGNRILDGQLPYVDFYEINFPMIQYLSTIFALGSRITGANIIIVTHIMTWLLIGWSALSSYFLTKRVTNDHHLPYIIPTTLIIFSTALHIPFIDGSEFAQREHLFMLLFLPFVLIRLHQWQTAPNQSGRYWRFIYGFIAAVGVAIKPHFAIIPILIELYGWSIHRDWRRLLRAEIYGFATLVILHVLYFVVFPNVREGLMEMVSIAQSGYGNIGGHSTNPIANLLFDNDLRSTILVTGIFWILPQSNKPTQNLIRSLIVIVWGGIVLFAIQRGFDYHAIVYQIALWILLFYGLARLLHPPHYQDAPRFTLIRNPLVYILLIITLYGFTIAINVTIERHTSFNTLTPYQAFIVNHTDEGDGILVIDERFDNGLNYPELYQINRHVISPYLIDFAFSIGWSDILTLEERIETYSPHAELWLEIEAEFINEHQPPLIIANPTIHKYLEGVGFLREVILPRYELIEDNSQFRAYQIIDS